MSDTQHQVSVKVDTRYLLEQSALEQNRFAFAYTVTIENQGEVSARLLSRHQIITDDDGRIQKVHDTDVVGKQPLITPDAQHTYISGTVLATWVGSVHSSYQILGSDGITFDATILVFRPAIPGALH